MLASGRMNRGWFCVGAALVAALVGISTASAQSKPTGQHEEPRKPRSQERPASQPVTLPAEKEKAVQAAARQLTEKYRPAAQKIIAAVRTGNDGYKKLEELCDDVGNRLAGSPGLEKAVEWAQKTLKADGQENVHAEAVKVPKWVRGAESLEMLAPRPLKLFMLGNGNSIGTPPEGITAEAIVVGSAEELEQVKDKVPGKIVVFNVPFPPENAEHGAGYGPSVRFRGEGAELAAKYGGVASLNRSATMRSLRSPHTGATRNNGAVPAASISIEDAMMLARLQARGIPIKLKLMMDDHMEPDAPSANVIGELRGSTSPDEVVVIGGHLDSWDVGQGAHDDGGGICMSMEVINVLRKLNLRPRRTIRVVCFTNEENGLAGGRAYAEQHLDELAKHMAAIETDSGTFAPRGYGVSINDPTQQAIAFAQLKEITTLLEPLGANAAQSGGGGADIGPMRSGGVPMLGHEVDMTHYFDYHHTQADTLDKVDPRDMTDNVATLAIMTYVLADMPGKLGVVGSE